jgi:hypothetical protein
MNFNKTLLALAIPLAMAGCSDSGGSSSSSDGGVDGGGGSTGADSISFSGRVADGYLNGATVCLDINENKKCDASDPSTTSVAGGAFSITDATQAQRDKYPLLVEIVVGSTIDEDNKGITLNKPLTLAAPAGYDFISPLSTMVQNEVEAGVPAADAEKIVQRKLGTELGLDEDYIAGKATGDNAEEYEKLHQVAQVTARVISENMETLADAAKENNISVDDLISAIVDEVFDALAEITVQVEAVAADENTSFDPDALATTVDNEFVDLDAGNIDAVVDQNEAEEAAVAVDMSLVLSSPGLAWFELETERYGLRAEYGMFYVDSQGATQETLYEWNDVSGEFSSHIDSGYAELFYALNDSGAWVRIDDYWNTVKMAGGTDGTFIVAHGNSEVTVTETLNTTEVNLEGLNIRSVMNNFDDVEGMWGNYLSATAAFPAGSKGYAIQLADVANNDNYIFAEDSYCKDEGLELIGGICDSAYVQNNSNVPNGRATSLADIKVDSAYVLTGDATTDMSNMTAVEIDYADTHKLWAEVIANGTVNYYKVAYDQPYSVNFLGASTWAAVPGSTVALELGWIDAIQEFEAYDSDGSNPVLALIEGYVRNAKHEGARPQPIERARMTFLNSTAAAAATAGFSSENLSK